MASRALLSLSPVSTATASRVRSLMGQGWDPVCSLEFGRCVQLRTDYTGKDAVKNRYLAKCTTVGQSTIERNIGTGANLHLGISVRKSDA